MTTVSGRVRPTVRLRQDDVDAACVLATSWASDRPFPRTVGVGVAFEIETASGEIFRIDPRAAVIALPVRRRERKNGVSREYAWVALDDEITVEGELDHGGRSRRPPALHATRIALAAPGVDVQSGRHHIPPRALIQGQADQGQAPGDAAALPAPAPNGEPPRRKKKKVLVTDPDAGGKG